jgi:aspartyl-tRNA synthetase
MMAAVFSDSLMLTLPLPFPRLTFDEAIDRFGTDKPDLRFGMELQDFAAFAAASDFPAFKEALAEGEAARKAGAERGVTVSGGAVKALVAPGLASYSRKQIEELEGAAKVYNARVFAWMKVTGTADAPVLEGGAAKFFAEKAPAVCAHLQAAPGDLILLCADSRHRAACAGLGAVRSRLGRDLGLLDPKHFAFAWIVDFPLFEYNDEESRWEAAHHMFSMPQERFHATLETDPGAVKGDLYDLVLNGYELASGSIRIHDPVLQKRIFRIVGFGEEEAQKRFGFLTDAFKFGAPPHGGIAPGLDRLVMLMCGETSIKEVIAFPKNTFAVSPMDDCPSEVGSEQLKDLHIGIVA